MKKIKNYNVNFTSVSSIEDVKMLASDANNKNITAVCASINTFSVEELADFREIAKHSKEAFGVPVIIGLSYYTNSAEFLVFGDKAIDFLVNRNHSESNLMGAKSLYDCSIILNSLSRTDMDMLNLSFNIKLIDGHIKYKNNVDELGNPDNYMEKKSLLWYSLPLAGSENNADSYSIVKKQLNNSKDLVGYILEKRPVSLFSQLMVPVDKEV